MVWALVLCVLYGAITESVICFIIYDGIGDQYRESVLLIQARSGCLFGSVLPVHMYDY